MDNQCNTKNKTATQNEQQSDYDYYMKLAINDEKFQQCFKKIIIDSSTKTNYIKHL